LEASIKRHDAGGKSFMEVTLFNPSNSIALMAHLQLRRNGSGDRVLPVYYSDNYVSMVPKESKKIIIEAATIDLRGEAPLLLLDGWNVDVTPVTSGDCNIALNTNALVRSWPVTGIPIKWFDGPLNDLKLCCGVRTGAPKGFAVDAGYDLGTGLHSSHNAVIDTAGAPSIPADVYNSARFGECTYTFPMKPAAAGYTVRLAFAEISFAPKVAPGKTSPSPSAVTPEATPEPDLTGKRVFNVDINDKPVLTNFDIFAAAGRRNKAVVKEFKAIQPDKEGNITIHFKPGPADQPIINGIEILSAEGKGLS
jgi:hypothetical protein